MYSVDLSESNLRGPLISLGILYESMPETEGCEKCREINGDNFAWCCSSQSPSLYYIEFLKIWEIVQNWSKPNKAELVVRVIKNYLDNSVNKGCVFFNNKCLCYEARPLICRFYGIIPSESWSERWKKLEERDGEKFEAHPQCDLVKTVSGKPITPEDENKWFEHSRKCEQRIGVPLSVIAMHDNPGGSYRSFHDHILLEMFPPDALDMLTKAKLSNPSKDDIEKTAENIRAEILNTKL